VLTAAAQEGRQAPSFETVRLSTDAFRARSSSEAKMPAEHCGKTELPFDLAQDQTRRHSTTAFHHQTWQ